MGIEREVRYKVDQNTINKIIENTLPLKEREQTLDITYGLYGFDSLAKTGRIFRLRKKSGKVFLEVKCRTKNGDWLEEKIALNSMSLGANFLTLAGLEPYLYLNRFREIRSFKNLKIFLDDLDLIGNFVEIEFQDSSQEELNEFLSLMNIETEPQPLYGDIVKELLKDESFKQEFDCNLQRILKDET